MAAVVVKTKTAHADCEHESTKLERERCRRARQKAGSMERHPAGKKRAPEAPAGALTWRDVNPAIYATALRLAGGNKSRIEIISPTEVAVG